MNFLNSYSLYCCEDIKSMDKKKLALICSYSSNPIAPGITEPELHCWEDGQVFSVDNKLVAYTPDGNIASIGGQEVQYSSDGQIHSIGGKVVNYFADGEIRSVGNHTVAQWYDDDVKDSQGENLNDNDDSNPMFL